MFFPLLGLVIKMLMNGKELLILKDCSVGFYFSRRFPSLSLVRTQTCTFTFAHLFLKSANRGRLECTKTTMLPESSEDGSSILQSTVVLSLPQWADKDHTVAHSPPPHLPRGDGGRRKEESKQENLRVKTKQTKINNCLISE